MRRLRLFADLVKFEHTIFALPFAYVGALLAARGLPTASQWLWITLAMVGARTAGMALNRLIDQDIDAKNPRTMDRVLPKGLMGRSTAWVIAIASLGLLLGAAGQLNPLCLMLSPIAAALLFFYSYTKRFTWLSHLFLGLVQYCAPVGGWVGVTGRLDPPALLLGLAPLLWIGGFDILYACQDVVFDQQEGLHSIPAAFGIPRALLIARGAHLGAVLVLAALGFWLHLPWLYLAGVGVVACLLVYEHTLVTPNDLSRLNAAFFTVNGWVSVTFLAFTAAAMLWRHGGG